MRTGGESVEVGLQDTAFLRGSYSLEGNGDGLSLGLDLHFVSGCQEQQITALWPSEGRREMQTDTLVHKKFEPSLQ